MKVLIGTNNKGKVEGAKQAFEKFYENVEVVGISVNSGVSDEPVNDEIYQGASNRVNHLIKYAEDNNVGADFFIGVESGITNKLGKWCIIQIAGIKDKNGYKYEEGATWTTDGFYRETKDKIEMFKQKGAVCVEMEGASIAAVCEYKKLKYFTFYYAGDNLDAVEWEERSLGQLTSFEKKARVPYLAFELARKIELCSE